MPASRRRYLSVALIALAVLSALSLVALEAREHYLARGQPRELPGPITHAAVSPYGVNVEMLGWDPVTRREALGRIAAAGFTWIRQPIPWGDDGGFQEMLEEASSFDLQVLPLLDGDPQTDYAPPADLQAFADWTGEFAGRYGSHLVAYQVWDEPNLGSHWGWEPVSPAGYAALLAVARDAILAADPDAVIVAAALAPTTEAGPANQSDVDYLDALYEVGADAYFDVAAGKPYGFDTGPADRDVSRDTLNFSRLILLREVMEQHGDQNSALWAGNFGWNALPDGWSGRPSIWGQTDVATQAAYTRAAYQRAVDEWPWAGVLFLENYAPAASSDDPRWGFALTDQSFVPRSSLLAGAFKEPTPNYQPPDPAVQRYEGGWRFQLAYGADISQSGDRAAVVLEGTDLGIHVRRGDYRAYLYVTVDGQPANALPTDQRGAYLNLTSPDQSVNDTVIVPIARHLAAGRHTVELVAERGWDQWALVGFSAANLFDRRPFQRAAALLVMVAVAAGVGGIVLGRWADWGAWGRPLQTAFGRLSTAAQLALTAVVAALFALTGWLTWLAPESAGGPFRRLGEGSQTLLVAAVLAFFYLSPWLLLNIASGLVLFILICWRLDVGLALVALSAPFYVYPKPMMGYRFSMAEVVMVMTVAAWGVNLILRARGQTERAGGLGLSLQKLRQQARPLDYAVTCLVLVASLSLLFTERLDVATNEWRVVVVEPALFYLVFRTANLDERSVWRVVDSWILGAVAVALLGLGWYVLGEHVITAEAGLPRLRSIYGSPNNVGLYLGRVIPVLLAALLVGRDLGWRRWIYGAFLLPALAAVVLSFSKGAYVLGIPVGAGLVLAWAAAQRWGWRRAAGLLVGLVVAGALVLAAASQLPALSGRFSLAGATTDFRVSLWKASIDMIKDAPWTGVGLDNFLYAYRGRYIRPEAWQEPSLSHPHNMVLDFWTRLGVLGLLCGVWLQVAYWRAIRQYARRRPIHPLALGLIGSMGATLAHGLVDQSTFLIDLAYAFMLAAGVAACLAYNAEPEHLSPAIGAKAEAVGYSLQG